MSCPTHGKQGGGRAAGRWQAPTLTKPYQAEASQSHVFILRHEAGTDRHLQCFQVAVISAKKLKMGRGKTKLGG